MLEREISSKKAALQMHPTDTGSTGVQIAALCEEIDHLTQHINVNKKDFGCRRSLLKRVAKRKTFLRYLKKTDEAAYKKVISTLGLKR